MTAVNRMSIITLVGNDAIDYGLALINARKQKTTVAEPPFYLEKTGVLDAVRLINKGKIEKKILLKSTLVTKEKRASIKTRD